MLQKDKKYYTVILWLVQLMLGISLAFPSVSNFHVGTNFIRYPYKVSQTIEDAIPSQYLSNICIGIRDFALYGVKYINNYITTK